MVGVRIRYSLTSFPLKRIVLHGTDRKIVQNDGDIIFPQDVPASSDQRTPGVRTRSAAHDPMPKIDNVPHVLRPWWAEN